MNRLYSLLAAGSILTCAAVAQDDHNVIFERMAPQVKVMSVGGGVMSKPVKGAPYSGVEVNESTQMLADGTRIHNESQTQVFRDSEGRMRRESGDEVTIWDPVANASFVLNNKDRTARKLPLGTYMRVNFNAAGNTVQTYSFTTRTGGPEVRPGEDGNKAIVEAKLRAELERVRAELEKQPITGTTRMVTADGATVMDKTTTKVMARERAASESLGKRTIEGVAAEGTRLTMTIEAGAIGNDRPIQSITEKWFSPDLQVTVLTRHTDPRTGEELSRLINVNRSEPAAYLFQVPAGYQMLEQK